MTLMMNRRIINGSPNLEHMAKGPVTLYRFSQRMPTYEIYI